MGQGESREQREANRKKFEESLKNMTYKGDGVAVKQNLNIAVIGLKGVGKSTYVNILKSHFNDSSSETVRAATPFNGSTAETISITPNINLIDCWGMTDVKAYETILTHLIDGTLPKDFKEGDAIPSIAERKVGEQANARVNGIILVIDPKSIAQGNTATHLSMLLLTAKKRRVPCIVVSTKLENPKKPSVEESKRLFIGKEKKIARDMKNLQGLFSAHLLEPTDIFAVNLSKFDAKDVYQRFQLLNSFQRISYLAEFAVINFIKRIDFVDVSNNNELVTSLSMDYHDGHIITLHELRLKLADKEGKFALTFFFLDNAGKEVPVEDEKTFNVDNLPKDGFGDNTHLTIKIRTFISYREAKKVVASKILNLDLADIPDDKVARVRMLEGQLPAFQIKYNPGVEEFPELATEKDRRRDVVNRSMISKEVHTMSAKKLNSTSPIKIPTDPGVKVK